MRSLLRRIAPVLLVMAFSIGGFPVSAKTPVMPIPTPRQTDSMMSPKSGLPRSSIKPPTEKAAPKRTWFPFGNRNKK